MDKTDKFSLPEQMAADEQFFRALVMHSSDGVHVLNEHGIITFVSPASEKLLGYKPEEMTGRPALDFLHPDDVEATRQILGNRVNGTFEVRIRHKNGHYLWMEVVRSFTFNHPLIRGAVVNYRDISERKLAEENLRKSEALFRSMIENSNDIILRQDRQGKVKYITPSITKIAGYDQQDFLETLPIDFLIDEDAAKANEDFKYALNNPGKTITSVYRLKHKNGHIIWLEGKSVNLLDIPGVESVIVNVRDITQSRDGDEKLRRQEAFYRALIEHNEDLTIMTDAQDNLLYCSPSTLRSLGYTAEEYAQKQPMEHTHPDDLELVKSAMQRAAQSPGTAVQLVLRQKNKSGHFLWMEGTVTNLLTTPAVAAVVYNLRDVTDRIAAELKARKSETILTSFFNSSTEAFLLVDRNYRIMTFNTKANQYSLNFGQKSLVVGDNILDILPPSRREEYTQLLTRVFANESCTYDSQATGTGLWYHVVVNPVRTENGNVIGACFIMSDITQQKLAQEALSKSEANLRTILNNADTAYVLLNNNFDILSFNQLANDYALLDLGKSLVEGDNFIQTLWKKWQPTAFTNMSKVLEGDTAEYESSYLQANGERLWFHVRINRILDDRDKVIGLCISASNITERKLAENQIREFSVQLEQKVKERTHELEVANKELESFSYSVSHDLRAPLRSLNGYSQALLEDYGTKLEERAQHYLKRIQLNSERMANLIDDLLKLSRVTRQVLSKQEINLSKVAREVLKELEEKYSLEYTNVHIDSGMIAQADPHLIRIALHNLLDNAIKFSAKSEQPEIIFSSFVDENNHKVWFVSDNGVGFDMQYAGKLFGAFQRLHDKDDYPGTGIGLSIVQRVINRHGGKIWAEASVNHGARFSFTL